MWRFDEQTHTSYRLVLDLIGELAPLYLVGELAPLYLGIRNSYPPRDARDHVISDGETLAARASMWIT